ncbi:imm11 family protein [Archangium lansingense]|uniref:imm11 family protein n=1 Tax=Archangium lansingense TaxID=2995310 RepID=UPI003B801B4D
MIAPKLYFDLWDDLYVPGRWHLSAPDVDEHGREIDPWQFKDGEVIKLESAPLLHMVRPGRALDFSLTGLTVPLVNDRVVSLFERLGLEQEVQFIPTRVEGFSEPYFLLNALRVIRCIDDARCEEVLYWLPEDNRPDKLGQYRNVRSLRVDPQKVGNSNIFRPWGWTVALIVSERIKLEMESAGITGTEFTEA